MKKYIIAVSGGPDSMALLHKYKRFVNAVCHVNYHDREDTDNDEMILREYCQKYNLKLFVFDTNKNDISKYRNEKNLQTFYRKIRYDFFEKIAEELNTYNCLIGQHKDDFIETAYMMQTKHKNNLFLGIRKKSYYKKLVLHRPLLNKWKHELQDYCDKKKIEYAIDYSNFSDKYQRNKIRKMFKEYSLKEKEQYFKSIQKINQKNFFKLKLSNFYFKQWQKENYSVNFIKKIDDKYRINMWFLFLSLYGVKINHNKLINVDDFIVSYNGNNKKYRLLEDKFIFVKNKKIVMEGK